MNEPDADTYRTLRSPSKAEIKVKGSPFVATAWPVKSREEAESTLAQVSRQYHDATHNCFAYRIGVGDAQVYRSSDAGEPAGTAGQPILKVIQGADLTNVLVVVTRYFGGTKLGVGGLIKAYTEATQAALAEAEIVEIPILRRFRVTVGYDHIQPVLRAANSSGGRVSESNYGEVVQLTLDVPVARVEAFKTVVVSTTSGQAKIEELPLP